MSRNGSFAKSMNGIVSFDDGDGTVIEGSELSTGTINCTALNASSKVDTSQLFIDFVAVNENANISFISQTKFNNDVYVDSIYGNAGGITLKNNTSVTGVLYTNSLSTERIEGKNTSSLTKQLKIGQDNELTTSINIGRKELNILGTVYPAIPPRTTFYAVGDDDIANKKYVDSVVTGTNILSLENTFTGTTNTFKNIVAGSAGATANMFAYGDVTGNTLYTYGNINNVSESAPSRLFRYTTTGNISVAQGQTTGTLGLGAELTRTGEIFMGATGCITTCRSPFIANLGLKLPTATNSIDTDTAGATISLFDSLTSGILNIGKGATSTAQINIGKGTSTTAQVNLGITDFYGNATCRSAFYVDNISARTTTLFNYTIYNTINTNSTITLGSSDITNSSQTYISRNNGTLRIASSDSRNANVNICDGANFSGSCNIITNTTQAASSTINLGSSLTSVNICNTDNFARLINIANTNAGVGVVTTNTINIGSNMSDINIGNVSGTTSRTINIGVGARTLTSAINIGTGSGTTTTPITIGSAGTINTIYGKVNNGTTRQLGYTSYVIHNGSSGNYTITDANINIDLYIVVIGTVDCSVLLNANIAGQRVYIRNAMGAARINNVISPTSNIIKAGGGVTNFITMTENTGMMLLCDGATWIVMMKY